MTLDVYRPFRAREARGESLRIVGPLLCWLGFPSFAGAQEIPPADSVVPLAGVDVQIGRQRAGAVPLSETPFTAHVVTAADLRSGSGSITGALSNLPGVTLTNQTGSEGQPDLRVRGFAMSPIAGVPQSVSVFVDGVRVNEADASQVHLSLIPEAAIERIEFVRGPVGVFGKNSLAGALNFVTRRGTGAPMLEAEILGGSFGTVGGTLAASGSVEAWDGLILASHRRADGWRSLEGSRELSVFAKLGWRGRRTDAWLSYTFEADSLEGPGPLPESWLEGEPLPPEFTSAPSDRRLLQYTGGRGDSFRPRLHFLSTHVEHEFAGAWRMQTNAFVRSADFRQANDNISEPDALGLTDIVSFGGAAQLLFQPHQRFLLAAGTEWTRNEVDIEIRERPNRSFPALIEATTEQLRTDEDNLGSFGEAWWSIADRVSAYASLRYDHVDLPVEDLLDAGDSGRNTFSEISGGVGISADLAGGLSAFAGYGRGFRAPVILEVTCADPEDPCQLPFELGPDPPLRPVKSDAWQTGLRVAGNRSEASLVGYWTEVRDDIFSVIDEKTPTLGYFTNLERTRRLGIELATALAPIRSLPGLQVSGSFAWTRATFQSRADLASPLAEENPPPPGTPTESAVTVQPGDHFPMIPHFAGTLAARYDFTATRLEAAASWTGPRYLVGDEGNDQNFDRLSSNAILDLRLERRLGRATAYVEMSNVLDSRYHAFGIIAENARAVPEEAERFLTPGLPRRLSIGVKARLWGESEPSPLRLRAEPR